MKNKLLERLTRLAAPPARLVALLLAVCATGSAWAVASAGDPFNWDNLSVNKGHNQSNTSAKWTITLNATDDIPAGSVVAVTEIALCSRNTYSDTTLKGNDPRYLKIGEVYSEVVNGTETVSGETLTANGSSYPKLSFKFADGGVNLTVGTTYDMYLYNTGKASATANLGAKLVQSNDSKSSLVMTAQGGGYYPLGKITGTVVSTTPVYESSPTGTSINFSDLSWTLNGDSTSLPNDVSTSVLSVTLDDGAELAFDTDVSALALRVYGQSAVLDFDSTKEIAVSSTWDFSGMSGCVTLRNFPDTLSDAKVTLPTGGVRVEGSESLSYLPYMSSVQTKHVDIAQSASITSGDGAYFKFVKSDYQFSSPGEFTFSRFAMGNKDASSDDATQTITQNGGTITVTGNADPTSNQASTLLGHWSSTSTLNTLGGTFNALNASTRLGWDGDVTWNIGGGTSSATANILGIVNGANGHTGSGTLNINPNGTLNLGGNGIAFSNGNNGGAINLAGGTIVATADTSIANSKAAGTILNSSRTTTINTSGHTLIMSAPLSGAGQLTKTGEGNVVITGSGTSTGKVVINGGKVVLSGNEAKIGTGTFELRGGHLDVVPGLDNTITCGQYYFINSSDGYNSQGTGPQLSIGPGTVVVNCSGSSANGHFAQATINILEGGDLQLPKGDLLGYKFNVPINIAHGGKLTISRRQTLTRTVNLNGGSMALIQNENDTRSLDLFAAYNSSIQVSADSSIDGDDGALVWIRNGAAPINVASGATLSLNAVVGTITDSNAGTEYGINKTGVGTLRLTKANTAVATLAVNAGTVDFDGGSWVSGTVSVAGGARIQSETSSAVAGTLTLTDGATVVRSSEPVSATTLTALASSDAITIAFADGVTPTDGMVILSGAWTDTPNKVHFAFADSSITGFEFVVTDTEVRLAAVANTTTVTVGGTAIEVENTWLNTALMTSYSTYNDVMGSAAASAFLAKYYDSTTQTIDPSYLTDNGLNGMPRAVSYLLGLSNPDDASTAFVMTAASAAAGGESNENLVLTFTGKTYTTSLATVTYSLKGGNDPANLSAVSSGVSVNGNVVKLTVTPSDTLYKYYAVEMTVVPN